MGRIIDADTHFIEPHSIYLDHIEPRHRDRALCVSSDEKGWPWLTHRGRRIDLLDLHTPGRVDLIGEQRRRRDAGEPWVEVPPPIADGCDPAARIRNLESQGVDASIVFPNLGLVWEDQLRDDPISLCANLEAYHRWLFEQLPHCGNQLFPVAQLSLRDLDWFEGEIQRCAKAGIKLAMIAPQPIGSRALAHPDFDRVWAAFQDLDMGVCFHVSSIQLPLDPAWYALDPQPGNKLMDTAFLYLAPAVAVASLIVHGKLEQFPRLRIGITELSAGWVPGFLLHLDGAAAFYESQNGAPLTRMPLRPSEYFKRQVRVNAFPLEGAAHLMTLTGENVFTWGSDYPHAEGMKRPSWANYLKAQPREMNESERTSLSGGNAAFLLGERD